MSIFEERKIVSGSRSVLDPVRIGFQPKMLDPDPDEMNADPHP
jgi:hypothetical protein